MAKANDEKSTYDHMAKVLVLGDSTVGKTCFLTRFCDGAVSNAHIATIGRVIVLIALVCKLTRNRFHDKDD